MSDFQQHALAKLRLHEQAFVDHDARLLVERFFDGDAVFEFQGFPGLRGADALGGFFANVVTTSIVTIDLLEARGSGDRGWTLVDYHVLPDDAATPGWTSRTLFSWVLRSGDWRADAGIGHVVDAEPGHGAG